MDIIIFKREEILPDIFKDLSPFKYIEYSSIDELKSLKYGNFKELDITKCKIDSLSKELERSRRAAAKYLHEYELVKIICKKTVCSRAYFKLYEMIFFEKEIIHSHKLDCFFICEAPGGFIECVTDIRRKKNLKTEYLSISILDHELKYDRYLEQNNLLYGDITDISVIDSTINDVLHKFPNKLKLITADGGFDVKNFNSQEILSQKLILSEIYLALNTQAEGGMFIIKFFDMFTHNSIVFYFILCSMYSYVKIIKPHTSRCSNSERYLMCYNFKGINNDVLSDIRKILLNFISSYGIHTLVYPGLRIDNDIFIKKIHYFNELILSKQIKTINESIKMVQSKDIYFQSLLLKLFMDKVTMHYILVYKNILSSRIKKCITWLRIYSINTNHMVYRFE
jgi:23S rRNA U2552 (ribose-2'-O)-methylase RlmE/FtsJ